MSSKPSSRRIERQLTTPFPRLLSKTTPTASAWSSRAVEGKSVVSRRSIRREEGSGDTPTPLHSVQEPTSITAAGMRFFA